ncbi:agmatine deiminase family protein [Candidatus Peregrinibacteria bacterium]|nr:agmatine deiminase family protein [Candidatus Peregrinibacteria bacterium]
MTTTDPLTQHLDHKKFHMPAEWEPHSAMWLSWPHNYKHWNCWLEDSTSAKKYQKVLDAYCEAMHVMQESEAVHLLVNDEAMEHQVRERLLKLRFRSDNLKFFHIKTNVPWTRDHGPIFVKNATGEIAITDWIFNAWGGKYPPWEDDDAVPTNIGHKLNIPVFNPGIVLEGGSIDVNGKGTLLTTTSCLLNKNRNPNLTKEQIEQHLKDYLGVTNILWLGEGIVNDDTDGHIDDLARFVNPTTVVCVKEDNPKDPNYKFLKDNFAQLEKMKDQDGKPLTIIPLPMPNPVIYVNEQMPASYTNFYIGNKIVLLPTFRQPKDEIAKNILQKLFPNRKIIGVDAYDVIWGQGSWHCLSQQQPA